MSDQFDFLIDIVPRELQHERARAGGARATGEEEVDDGDDGGAGEEYYDNGNVEGEAGALGLDDRGGQDAMGSVPMGLGDASQHFYEGVGGGLYVESYAREGASGPPHGQARLEQSWGEHDGDALEYRDQEREPREADDRQ